MFSAGMRWPLALSIAVRRRGLKSGSPPPSRAATAISRPSLEKSFPFALSVTAFWRLIFDHFEWPATGYRLLLPLLVILFGILFGILSSY